MGIKCQDSRTIKVRNLNATFWYQQGGRNVISTNDSLSHNTTLLVWALPGIQMWLCFIFLQIQIGLRCELWFNFLSRGPNTPRGIFAILPRPNRPQNFSCQILRKKSMKNPLFFKIPSPYAFGNIGSHAGCGGLGGVVWLGVDINPLVNVISHTPGNDKPVPVFESVKPPPDCRLAGSCGPHRAENIINHHQPTVWPGRTLRRNWSSLVNISLGLSTATSLISYLIQYREYDERRLENY